MSGPTDVGVSHEGDQSKTSEASISRWMQNRVYLEGSSDVVRSQALESKAMQKSKAKQM